MYSGIQVSFKSPSHDYFKDMWLAPLVPLEISINISDGFGKDGVRGNIAAPWGNIAVPWGNIAVPWTEENMKIWDEYFTAELDFYIWT